MPRKSQSSEAPSDAVRWQVTPTHVQMHLQLSFSKALTYIFQFHLIGSNGIWDVLNDCATAERSSDLELQPEAVQKQTGQTCSHPCTQALHLQSAARHGPQ